MARKAKPPESASTPSSAPEPSSEAPFTTTDYGVVKRLYAAKILARTTYGSPMVYEYWPADTTRIQAILVR